MAMVLENLNPAIPKQSENLFIEKYVDNMIEVFEKVYPESMLLLGPFTKEKNIISCLNKDIGQ
jgi:hypothetical protein